MTASSIVMKMDTKPMGDAGAKLLEAYIALDFNAREFRRSNVPVSLSDSWLLKSEPLDLKQSSWG